MRKYFRLKSWLLALLLSLLGMYTYGQNRPVRILYHQAPAGAPSKAYIYSDLELLGETELPRANFSETFEIPRGEVLLKFIPNALTQQEKMPKRAPSANIPKTWQKILLLVFEDESNPMMPIRIQAVDASDNIFGPGCLYMMNFSKIGIAGKLGDKNLQLKPQSIKIIKNPIPQDGFYLAKLDAYIGAGHKPRRFIKQMWQHSHNTRQVLFIMPKPSPRYATYYCAPVENF